MALHRPGTYVDESLLATNTPATDGTAYLAFVLDAVRGPVLPVKLESWSQATSIFGQFSGNAQNDRLLQAMYMAYLNGGRTMYAVRAVGTGALVANRSLLTNRTIVAPALTAAPALVVSSSNPGAWGNRLYVEISQTSVGRFNLTVRELPVGTTTLTNQSVVDRISDLSLDPADPRYIVSLINAQQSNYITVALDPAFVFAPGDTVAASSAPGGDVLAGGNDGAAVTSAQLVSTISTLDAVDLSPLVLNLPGVTAATVVNGALAYADPDLLRADGQPGRGDVFVIIDTDPGVTSDAAITTAVGAGASPNYVQSSYGAVYYPNLLISDPSSTSAGATKLIPAGGAVAGQFAANDAARGFFKAPAGEGTRLVGILGLDPAATLRNPALDKLADAQINAIKIQLGIGPVIFGARTMKRSQVDKYISVRRTLINARVSLTGQTGFAAFENNDSFLWDHLASVVDAYCRQLLTAGGLKGTDPQQAYYVKCDSEINTAQTIDNGEVHIEVGLALQRPAEFVILRIGQFDGSAAVTESRS